MPFRHTSSVKEDILAMPSFGRPIFLAAAASLAAAPAGAREGPRRPAPHALLVRAGPVRPAAATLGVAVAPGVVLATPFTVVAGEPERIVRVPHYIGPDGTYDEYADLVKSINGTPCGQECTRRSLRRWGTAPVD